MGGAAADDSELQRLVEDGLEVDPHRDGERIANGTENPSDGKLRFDGITGDEKKSGDDWVFAQTKMESMLKHSLIVEEEELLDDIDCQSAIGSRLALDEEVERKSKRAKKLNRLYVFLSWLTLLVWVLWLVFYITFMVFISLPDDLGVSDWGYDFEKIAPPAWADLGKENSMCNISRADQMQSPIEFRARDSQPGLFPFATTFRGFVNVVTGDFEVEAEDGRGPFYYCKNSVRPSETSSSVTSCGTLVWKTIIYHLQEIRVKTPAEHLINGVIASFENQYIFRDSTDTQQAAVSVFYFGLSNVNNTALNPLWWSNLNATSLQSEDSRRIENLQLNALIDLDSAYFQYDGSDTIPPCKEDFAWFLQSSLEEASLDQVRAIQVSTVPSLGNARPPAPLRSREVFQSDLTATEGR